MYALHMSIVPIIRRPIVLQREVDALVGVQTYLTSRIQDRDPDQEPRKILTGSLLPPLRPEHPFSRIPRCDDDSMKPLFFGPTTPTFAWPSVSLSVFHNQVLHGYARNHEQVYYPVNGITFKRAGALSTLPESFLAHDTPVPVTQSLPQKNNALSRRTLRP